MNKRELRIAIQEKLEHRRSLMATNLNLKGSLAREQERNSFLVKTLANPLVDRALEECADEIMKAIIDEAIKASSVVADQMPENGNYMVGMTIPTLHIRTVLYREDLRLSERIEAKRPSGVKRVSYDGRK